MDLDEFDFKVVVEWEKEWDFENGFLIFFIEGIIVGIIKYVCKVGYGFVVVVMLFVIFV